MADEDDMWEKDILGTDTPDKLRDTFLTLRDTPLFHFDLRGGTEQYNLRYGENKQLKLDKVKYSGREFLEYKEDVFKMELRWNSS